LKLLRSSSLTLVLALVTLGCGSSDKKAADGAAGADGAATTADGAATGGSDGGTVIADGAAGTGGSGGAAIDAGAAGTGGTGGATDGGADAAPGVVDVGPAIDIGGMACNQLVNGAPVVSKATHAGPAPTMTGGTVVDGTYFLTAIDKYNDETGSGMHQETWVFAGNTFQSVTSDTVDGKVNFRASGTYTTAGNKVTLSITCPGVASLSTVFTATATQIQTVDLSDTDQEMHTFTKQ
jgi:hypothetical protein